MPQIVCGSLRQHVKGGNLRSIGEIKVLANQYQVHAECSDSTKKLSSAKWKSCERFPIPDLPDDTFIIDVAPPPPLHIKLGIINGLFDTLNSILKELKHPMEASKWSDALGFSRSAHHGGQFKGNYCDKLMNNLDLLESMLKAIGAHKDCLPVIEAFKMFRKAYKACFQKHLEPTYKRDLQDFGNAYLELITYCRQIKAKCSEESVKVHAACVHVRQFLERQQKKGFEFGLGYWSEEASEACHDDWDSLWVDKNYKRDLTNANYATNAHEAIIKYNSGHIGGPPPTKEKQS